MTPPRMAPPGLDRRPDATTMRRSACAEGAAPVITAIVLIDCATDSIPEVAEALANLAGVSEVYSVAGSVDLIALVRVRHFDEIAEVIAGGISKTPGVINTDTHIAFRAYSQHDLEEAFSIGFADAD